MSKHTLMEDFHHFLSYTGLHNESDDVKNKLFRAYEHGSERNYDFLEEAYQELSGKENHASDCSIHNAPAMRPERCDCSM